MHLKNKKVLITGVGSGLGKYFSKEIFNSFALSRHNKADILNRCSGVDLVIHCAFNTKSHDRYQLLKDNIFLTKELCELNPKKIVYISSIDVYNENKTNYNTLKLFAESIVENESNDFLILRCPALVGADMRKNNFLKIVEDDHPKLSLTGRSSFNFISHNDLLKIIDRSVNVGLSGVYDAVSSGNVTLKDIAEFCGKDCDFGKFTYSTPQLDNAKIISDFEFMNKKSIDVVKNFLRENYE